MGSLRTPLCFLAAVITVSAACSAAAAPPAGTDQSQSRFVSLRASEVNMRAGPGEQYPIAWVYRRPGLPLEVVAEFDVWRRVRDWEGEEGWVHSNMLSTRRTVIITDGLQSLREKPDAGSPVVARAEAGVVARLLRCPARSSWCRIEVNGLRGWTSRLHIWGVHRGETVD
jgi:SH3-like domain-containing protein